jgi:hypothetical protein
MNDFRNDEALMCAGLDNWFRSPPDASLRIQEERLSARLGCEFFVKPPEFSEQEGGPKQMVPHVRFPLWHYCPSPRCFQMGKATLFGGQPVCTNANCMRQGRKMIPIRIVAVCENGHIEDFPFREWIGCTCADQQAAQLVFKAGRSSASLAGIRIDCEVCGKGRSLAGAFERDSLAGIGCSGAQPWLGREKGAASCSCSLQTVQRGGSNVYFPAVQSAIYVPPAHMAETEEIKRVLDNDRYWTAISSALIDGKINPAAGKAIAMLAGVDEEALISGAQARLDGAGGMVVANSEEDFRRQEYQVLCSGVGDPTDELFVERIGGTEYGWLAEYVKRVGLVRKLRETRVLTGFSRLVPKSDRGDPAVQPLSINNRLGWLPGIEIRGEGIFIEFQAHAIREWETEPGHQARTEALLKEYKRQRQARKLSAREVDSRFLMIHSFAHALIKELTFACGYGSASLRERLYCNLEDAEQPMNGLLIYTASGDSEGTLGGLVAQARPGSLERVVGDALRRSGWCSNDPVCIESPGQGAGSFNLAACHGCLLLPETSCEEGNRLLDRALLCGTVDDSKLGFFAGAPL